MERYIALMRGVNVGGKNKVSMPVLKEIFENNGFADVLTYINSGNIIFSSEESDQQKLMAECQALVKTHFQLEIPISIIAASELAAALAHAPAWWDLDPDSKHNAIFVLPPVTVAQIFNEVGDMKPDYEKVDQYGNVIFWSAPIKTFSRTRLSKVVGTAVYKSITIRNANTTKKLLALAK